MKETTTQSHAPHITNDLSPVRQGYKWTEVGVIPEDWEIQRLDAICSVYSGGTPSTARHDFYGGHIPWITSGDLNARRITEVSSYLTQAGFDSSAAKMIESGDLVVALYGATAGVVAVSEIEAAINQAVLSIRTNRCDSEYLFHHLESRRNQIVATYTQGGQPNLSGGIICSLVIVIPTRAEQRAIAKVLSDVDGLINALDALIAKKRAIKQATMQQLLTGKTRLPGFSGAWETKRFEELFKRLNGNSHKIQSTEYSVNGLHPVIDQGQDTIVAYSDQTEKLFKCPADGVIVFGDHTRIVKFVDVDFLIGADGTQLLAMKGNDVTKFLYYQLSTKDIPNTGYNRHFKFLKDLTFKIPRTEEQRAIATVLSDMDTEITALEHRRDKTIAIKQGMMQQLLTGNVRLLKSNAM